MHHLEKLAPSMTYGGTGATVLFWGLQLNEVCAIVSTLCAIVGVLIQIRTARKNSRQ